MAATVLARILNTYLTLANTLLSKQKSHESKDAFNTRHKVFGQLLKEHDKASNIRSGYGSPITLGILIPRDEMSSGKSNTQKSGYDFYREGYLEKRGQIYFSLNIVRSALCLRAPFSLIKR